MAIKIMKKLSKEFITNVGVAVVVGFLSGLVGYSLFNSVGVPFFGRVNFADFNFDRQIVIDQPRSVTVEQDLQVKQVENDLLPVLLSIYWPKKVNGILEKAYLPQESLGGGLVITTDGWAISTKKALTNLKSDYVGIGYQNKQYELSDLIEDKATGLVFAKMAANNLPVAKIGRSGDLISGQTVVVVSDRKNINLAHIKRIGYVFENKNNLIQSSEALNKKVILDIAITDDLEGATVANLKGEVVGMITGGEVVPVDYFKNLISQVLEKKTVIRPVLGITYLDLAHIDGTVEVADRGAYIYNVLKTSPAYGQLKIGDIIKKVDDIEVNVYKSLSELTFDYKTGKSVEFLISRDGQDQTVDIVLN